MDQALRDAIWARSRESDPDQPLPLSRLSLTVAWELDGLAKTFVFPSMSWTRSEGMKRQTIAVLPFLLGMTIGLGIWAGPAVLERVINDGKIGRFLSDVWHVRNKIEDYRAVHGAYPAVCSLEDLQEAVERKFSPGIHYCSNGTGYLILYKPFEEGPCVSELNCAYGLANGEWIVWPMAADRLWGSMGKAPI